MQRENRHKSSAAICSNHTMIVTISDYKGIISGTYCWCLLSLYSGILYSSWWPNSSRNQSTSRWKRNGIGQQTSGTVQSCKSNYLIDWIDFKSVICDDDICNRNIKFIFTVSQAFRPCNSLPVTFMHSTVIGPDQSSVVILFWPDLSGCWCWWVVLFLWLSEWKKFDGFCIL